MNTIFKQIKKLVDDHNLCLGQMEVRCQSKKDIGQWKSSTEPYSLFYLRDPKFRKMIPWPDHLAILKIDLLIVKSTEEQVKGENYLYIKTLRQWAQCNDLQTEWVKIFNKID